MTANLTCTQVSALLSFYIDDKLSSQLKQFVESHLAVCPTCRMKLETLRSMVISLRNAQDKLSSVESSKEENLNSPHYDEFKINLSAYIDNELNDEDNIKVKKYIVSNPKARQEIESMYNLKKVLHNAFEKTKNEFRDDFSKYIMSKIDMQEEIYRPDPFAKVVAIMLFILVVFTITAVVIFWV